MRLITVTLLLFVLLAGCSERSVEQNPDLEAAIHSIVEDENESKINIGALTDFDWTKAFLFEPYTPEVAMVE